MKAIKRDVGKVKLPRRAMRYLRKCARRGWAVRYAVSRGRNISVVGFKVGVDGSVVASGTVMVHRMQPPFRMVTPPDDFAGCSVKEAKQTWLRALARSRQK